MKAIELGKKEREQAVASIKRYFAEELPEPIGDLPAGLLLNFFLEEIGPAIYNQAVGDAQTPDGNARGRSERRTLRR